MRISSFVLAVAALLASSLVPLQSHADTFSASYRAAGVQTPGATNYVNTFSGLQYVSALNTTTFNGSLNTGTYSGAFSLSPADLFGGAGGTGTYISTNTSYTLSLLNPANYFGVWLSAMNSGNKLTFYKDNTLLYSFSADTLNSVAGSCPSATNALCGNPNTNFLGQDSNEQFAYLNFVDTSGTFNKVVFSGTGFESDNHAVAFLSNTNGQLGTAIVTPEPSSWVLAITGIGAIVTAMGFRRSALL